MKKIILVLLIGFTTFSSFGKIGLQNNIKRLNLLNPFMYDYSSGYDPERVIFGGYMGMNFFDNKGYELYIAPTIGYQFGNHLQMGVNVGYSYTDKTNYFHDTTYAFKGSDYSASLFMRFFFLRYLFLMAEPEVANYKYANITYTYNPFNDKYQIKELEYKRTFVPAFNVGGGVAIPLSDRIALMIYCLYDLVQNENSPSNGHPIIRGGFSFAGF